MTRAVAWGVLVALVLAFFASARCVDVQAGRTQAITALRDSIAVVVAREHQQRVRAVDSVRAVFANAERARQAQLAHSTTALVRSGRTVDSLRALLADTPASAEGTVKYRLMVGEALAQYDSLAAAFRAYLRADSVTHRVTDALVVTLRSAIASAEASRDAERARAEAWRQASRCRVLGVPCPTRRTAFLAGAVVGVAGLTMWAR